jgi:hypothetical protein
MSQVANAIFANLVVRFGVANDSNGNPLPPLYVQLFDTITHEEVDDYYPPGTQRGKHDDMEAFEKVWMEIEQDERLLRDLETVQDVDGLTVFAKAVDYDCVEITRMLIYEDFGDRHVAISYSQHCSQAMYDLLIAEDLLVEDKAHHNHIG